jgi:predicted esterase
LYAGQPVASAGAALVLVHGRGGTADSILALAGELSHPKFAYLAPQAAGNSWYPFSFMAPLEQNEPDLSSALAAIGTVLAELARAGLSPERTVLLGFSQGACLVLEYAARHARRYGGVVGLSGGLIGPPGTPFAYPGSLSGTPVFLGCSDADAHIPKERVLESAEVFRQLGANATAKLYPGLPHTINQDELSAVRTLMEQLLPRT